MIEPRQHGYFKIHNANIYYRIYGTGEKTMFFIHGNGEDWTCFTKQIEYFANDFKVVTMDSRGHGQSGAGEKPLTIKQIAQDATALIMKLHLEHVTLVGFRDGANIVLEMALNSTFPYEKLILGGANLNPKGVKMRYQIPTILAHAICECAARFYPKLRLRADILGMMIHEPRIRPERLRKITIPTLVMAGEHDMIKENHTRLIAAAIPDSTLEIIPGANRFIFNKWADKVNYIMKKFMAS